VIHDKTSNKWKTWLAYQKRNKAYDKFRPLVLYRILARYFSQYINRIVSPASVVLDAGCGTGNSTYFLDCMVLDCKLIGCDISKNMLEVASTKSFRNKVEFINADLDHLQFNHQFDAIQFFMVMHHFPNLDGLLDKVHQLLKQNGFLIILGVHPTNPLASFIDAIYTNWFGQGVYYRRTRKKMIEILKRNNFSLDVIKKHPILRNYTMMLLKSTGSSIEE